MTTSEIAKKLGISRGTVSRALNNHPGVKPETRRRILDAAREFNYMPGRPAPAPDTKKKYRIAVIVFSQPAFFWESVEKGVNTAKNDLVSQGIVIDYFITDILKPEQQLKLVQTLPKQGYHGIIIAPNNPQLLANEIDRLSNSGFPVVIINVEIPTANQICYIGCDYIQSGVLAGELFSKFLTQPSELLVLTLKEPVYSIEQRITGFRKELSRHSHLSIGRIERFGRDGSGVYENLLRLQPELSEYQGIFVSFDALEQTADAICHLKLSPSPIVIGYDLNSEIFRLMKNGLITAAICHEPFNQGYYAVKILCRYLKDGALPSGSLVYNKLEIVTAANARYYLDEPLQAEIRKQT